MAMPAEHRFDPYGDEPQREKRQRSWLSTCLIGCLVIVVVGLLVVGVGVYWITQNWRGWTSTAGAQAVMQNVNASDLPEQEKREIEVQVKRVADAFGDGRISFEQLGKIIEKLMESPVLTTIIVSTAETKYLDPSGLSDEEKDEARITIQRFTRGAVDGTIDQNSMDMALEHIADPQEGGGWRLRMRVSDAELRAFLAVAKAEADEANIPEEPEEFDASDEIKRIIDDAMGEQLAEMAPAE
jgi:hypothetical protein